MMIICVLTISVLTASASERWEQVAESKSGTRYYLGAYSGRINTYSAFVREWSLWDYSSHVETAPYGSDRFLHEYDCEKRRWKVLRHQSHKGPMGAGEVIDNHTYVTPEWQD